MIHKDDEGNVVDHSGSTGVIAFRLTSNNNIIKFPDAVHCSATKILVQLSPNDTKMIKPGSNYHFDLIVKKSSGEAIRMLYGTAELEDTYAYD